MAEIDIAIPAYNCAAWLDDLIESILQQDVDNWRIVARDDASTDGTAARLATWKQRLGERMMIVDGPDRRNLGPVGNYNAILSATTSHWIMLADSDDVWRPGKLALTLQAMRAAESAHGTATPVLVFTDAEVVDEQLRPVHESYLRWSRANLAAAFGQIVKLDERTILYRRHSANDSLEPYAATTKGMVHRLLAAPSSARK